MAFAGMLLPTLPHLARGQQLQLPFKLPQGTTNPLAGLEQKAAQAALAKVLDNELPLRLDATTIYPTVSAPPGGPFKPVPLHLSAADLERPLPPGDYTIETLAFCNEYSVHRPGAGTAYVLAPLQGKAADALYALLWRGTIDKHLAPQQLQAVSWAIQSGLTYAQMPKTYQSVIDAVIPDYKSQLEGNYLQHLQDTYQSLSKGTKLPPLEKALGDLGPPGQTALTAMRQQQILMRQNTSDQLREQTLFRGQESGVYTPVKAQEGPWTVRIPNVAYMRLKIVGGNMASNNTMEIRVLPNAATRTVRNLPPRLLRVMYGTSVLTAATGGTQPTPHSLYANTSSYAEGQGAQNLGVVPKTGPGMCPPPPPKTPTNLDANASQCSCKTPNLISPQVAACEGKPAIFLPAPGSMARLFELPNVDVITDYCIGSKVDGIVFEPKAADAAEDPLNARLNTCTADNIHIMQFVQTTCLDGQCDASYVGTCNTRRNLGVWYLDECPSDPKSPGPKSPWYPTDAMVDGVHVIADQPDVWMNGHPVQKTFDDVVMCGDKVIDAFTWTRKADTTSPPRNERCDVPASSTYSPVVPTSVNAMQTVICTIGNIKDFPGNAPLNQLEADVGGCQNWRSGN